jgi:hypothetical protein
MSKEDNNPTESETILMALDQISQTIDVMTSVVGRLRNYVHQQGTTTTKSEGLALTSEMPSGRVLH